MAAFLGALEYILEEGPSKDWFESEAITYATILSAAGAIAFFWRVTSARNPIVDLTAFRDRNFWSGCALSFILGIGLYGLTYIYPVYLAVVRGYSPLMIGNTMFVTGVCQFLIAPIVGQADDQGRPALDDRRRLRRLRRRHVDGVLRHFATGTSGSCSCRRSCAASR